MNLKSIKPKRISDQVIEHHRNIYEAIKNKSSKAAYQAMHGHIEYVMDYFENS